LDSRTRDLSQDYTCLKLVTPFGCPQILPGVEVIVAQGIIALLLVAVHVVIDICFESVAF
jgi:hypothetical protein